MYAIRSFFLGVRFLNFIGLEAVDHVKMPWAGPPLGGTDGVGVVMLQDRIKLLQTAAPSNLSRRFHPAGDRARAPRWSSSGYLARGNDGHTLAMVAINSLTMHLLCGPLGRFLLGVGQLPAPGKRFCSSRTRSCRRSYVVGCGPRAGVPRGSSCGRRNLSARERCGQPSDGAGGCGLTDYCAFGKLARRTRVGHPWRTH
jgi:hypothetical protein